MKRVLNLFLAVLLVCTVNGLGDLQAQSNNKVAQLEKLSAIEKKPQKTIRKRTAAIRHSLKTAASAESVKLFGCMTYSSKWSTSEKWGIRHLFLPRRGRNRFHASQNSSRFQSVGSRLCRREILRIPSHDLRLYRVWRQLLPLRHGRLDARHTADTQSLVRQLSYQPRLR